MSFSSKKSIGVLLLICLLAAAVLVVALKARDQWAQHALEERVQQIIALIDVSDEARFHERVDAARRFVHEHSIYKQDDAFDAILGNPVAIADRLIAHAMDPAAEPAHLECSTRANILSRILHGMGYRTRTLAVFNTAKNLQAHTLLDVLNPETGEWESQDPFYDVYSQKEQISGASTRWAAVLENSARL